RVGYSPNAWDRVVGASMKAGYSGKEILAAGLASQSRDRSRMVDRFRGRLMFPWADARGRVLGFGARALLPDDNPKYLNSAERAGQDATARGAGVLRALASPPEVRVAPMPAGQDPADVATAEGGIEVVNALLGRALPLSRWQVDIAIERGDLNASEGRDRVL